jgi:uncharacterized protein involved in outer membrane biogenesis
MKKWILIGSALIIVIIVAVIVLVSNIGSIIKTAVNTYGPDITKTSLRIENVGISIFSGTARLKRFTLGNPRGFGSRDAVRVKLISVDVEKESLTSDTIIINRVVILQPDVTYEKKNGTDNFQVILKNVQQSVDSITPSDDKSGSSSPSKKIFIRDLVIRDGKVTMVQTLFGNKGITVPLPDIHLRNIGSDMAGESPAKVADDVLKSLYRAITSPDVTKSLSGGAKSISEGASKKLKTGSSKLKKLFGK